MSLPAAAETVRTTRDLVDLMLNEEVDQRHQSTEECPSEDFSIFDSSWITWAECKTAQGPRKRSYQVRNHEDVVPTMIIRRGDIGPAAAAQCTEQANSCKDLGQIGIGPGRKNVP